MAREAKKLTKSRLDRLLREAKADPAFTRWEADGGQRGLYVWARRGRVRFHFSYRPPGGGGRRRPVIDEYGAITLDKAREIAQEWRGILASGRDPQVEVREKARRDLTVRQAVRRYLADLEARAESGAKRGKKSGYHSARHRLERNVLPRLGSIKLRAATVEQVKRLHRGMKATPVEANRTLTCLSAVFGYADRAELVPTGFNPTRHVERYAETGKRRALSAEELQALGRALREAEEAGSVHSSALLAMRLLALTGFRRAEVLGHETRRRRGEREGLRWGDVDLDAGLVHLRDSKTGAQTRVIGQAALDLLRAARPADSGDNDPVCPGRKPGKPFVGLNRPRVRLYKEAKLADVDLHSLRHSFASTGAHIHNGRYAVFVGPLLGHGYQKRSVTERYIHSDPEALRPAADAIAEAIARHLGLGEPGRVIAFRP